MVAYINLAEEAKFAGIKNIQSRYKLLNNLDKVLEWVTTGDTIPVLVNINPTNRCNHRCPLCTSKDFLDDVTFPTPRLKQIIEELAKLGVKAIGFGGGGDPTCHPDLAELIHFSAAQGLEFAMTTNGQLLNEEIIEAAVRHSTWLRVSLDASTPEIYKKTHGLGDKEFEQVKSNIEALVREKKRTGSDVTLGITYLLGPHTVDGAVSATRMVRDIGVDNIRLRPFFRWDQESKSPSQVSDSDALVPVPGKRTGSRAYSVEGSRKAEFDRRMADVLRECKSLQSESFSVSYPEDRILDVATQSERVHRVCSVHHFQSIITADMQVYPCCMLEGKAKYSYGSVAEKSFQEVWESPSRRAAYERIDFSDCPNPCMLEKHNELLWEIKHSKLRRDTKVSELIAASSVKIPHANFL